MQHLLFTIFTSFFCFFTSYSNGIFAHEVFLNTHDRTFQKSTNEFEQTLRKKIIVPTNNTSYTIGYIRIAERQSAISQATWIYINQALSYYKKTKPSCIILELNTPGGEVFAAQQICDALKNMDIQYNIPVIAYINNWAISAGAMIAYSCRYIVISKDASMGACEPVYMSSEGEMKSASEKITSALRSDISNRADFFGRNPYIAEAMVDKDIIVVQRDGKIIKLNSEHEIHRGSDIIISDKGKLLTLNAKDLINLYVANYTVDAKPIDQLTDEEIQLGKWPITKTFLSELPYFQNTLGTIDSYQMNWQTQFLAFLASPAISSLLFMGLLISAYLEFTTPGFGIAGSCALFLLFLLMLSSYALETVHILEPLLMLFGVALLSLEFFVFPTAGLLGLFGGLSLAIGFIGLLIPGLQKVRFDGTTLNAAGLYVVERLTWFSAAFFVALGFIVYISRYINAQSYLFRKIILDTPTDIVDTELPHTLPKIGSTGIVVAALRPSGKININNLEYIAQSDGSYIQEGKKVIIQGIIGAKILVTEIKTN